MKKRRKSLQKHLLNRLFWVMLVTGLFSLLLILFWVKPVIERNRMTQNRWQAYFIAQALESQQERYAESVRAAAAALVVLRRSHPDLDGKETREILQSFVEGDYALENLLLLDPTGVVRQAPPQFQAYEGLDLSSNSWFTADLPLNRPVWATLQFSLLSATPVATCVLRSEQELLVGFVNLQAVVDLVYRMQMPEGTHAHVFDQHQMTVVGHSLEETFTRTYAPHVPSDGFSQMQGSYVVDDGREQYVAEYYKLPNTGWVVAVMTNQGTLSQGIWLVIGGVFLLLSLVILAILLMIWHVNREWLRAFSSIKLLLHQISLSSPEVEAPSTQSRESNLQFTDFDEMIADFTHLLDSAHIAEEEAREKAAEAERADQAKNRFIGSISQEIRNPLGGILGASDLLLFRETDSEKRERLRLLRQSAELLQRTMDDVLDIANLESGRFLLVQEETQLHRLLEDLVLQYAPAAEKKGLELNLRWDRALPRTVVADKTRIRQLLGNLLENALKFTEEGMIRVSAQLDSVSDETVQVRFSVRDTGIGIPSDQQEQIFWEFHQVEGAMSQGRPRGTGLGLSVCRRLVAAMGGELGVESEVGQGSLFWVSLPLCRRKEETGDETQAAQPS